MTMTKAEVDKLMADAKAKRWYHLMYQAFVVDETPNAGARSDVYLPFSAGRSMKMVGSLTERRNSFTYTNASRCGASGLPMDWDVEIERVSLLCDRAWHQHPAARRARASLSIDMRTVPGFPVELSAIEDLKIEPKISLPEMVPFWFEVLLQNHVEHALSASPKADITARVNELFGRALAPVAHATDEYAENPSEYYHRESLEQLRKEVLAHEHQKHQTVFWIFIEGWGSRLVV